MCTLEIFLPQCSCTSVSFWVWSVQVGYIGVVLASSSSNPLSYTMMVFTPKFIPYKAHSRNSCLDYQEITGWHNFGELVAME